MDDVADPLRPGRWTPTRRRTLWAAAVVPACLALSALAWPQFQQRFLISHCGVGGVGEASARGTLRNLFSAQEQFSAGAHVDVDGDGRGEFGFFAEMSGAALLRTQPDGNSKASRTLIPPVLSGSYRTVAAGGIVHRSGYCFRALLPDPTGAGVTERKSPSTTEGAPCSVSDIDEGPPSSGIAAVPPSSILETPGTLDTDLAETTWCAYAWPAQYGNSGTRTFFVNQDGDIFATDGPAYSGANGPSPGAAFLSGGLACITGKVAVGTLGQDGQLWRRVD
jgi:hypothetical protein